MDPYMQCRLARQDEDSAGPFVDLLTNNTSKKKTRGPTQMRDIWGNHDGKKIQITCNDFGQPHDENANKLTSFIGTLVRDGKNAPINYKNWHEVPAKYKDGMWKIIQEKFNIPPLVKNWTMRTCGKQLRNWKSYLKTTYYSEHLSFEEQKKYKDKRVYDGQWEKLIKYWAIEDSKSKCAKNKTSRGEKKYNHTTGTKSFAQIRALQKEDGGSTPTRASMFKICYTKKDKSVVDENTKEAMLRLQEKEELNEDASKEKIRMYGFGVCPYDVWENKSTWRRNQKEYVDALKSKINELTSQVQTLSSKQNNVNDISIVQVEAPNHNDNVTSSQLAKSACPSRNKEPQRRLLFSSSSYDTLVAEVGEVVNLKSVTNDPQTIAIGLVSSKDPSKEVGGKELGDFFFEVIVQVPIQPNEQLIRAYGCFKTIGEVVGAPIAWPTTFVISRESDTQLHDSMM
ncbi:uncharacterized protein LOC133814235 [Humulus lupulus]|uniref:uncharacterized protein LOC133814235 n=1 Tax=Humulus lupulus TaxID=3486 RepID=UPI002B40367F|nr:uncharacterized protein LOC133814235 [Humulus lupulus]